MLAKNMDTRWIYVFFIVLKYVGWHIYGHQKKARPHRPTPFRHCIDGESFMDDTILYCGLKCIIDISKYLYVVSYFPDLVM